MNNALYDRRRATQLLPLLHSITGEIHERSRRIEELEARVEALEHGPRSGRKELPLLIAELATHRRELRLAKEELTRLGCTIVGTQPLTVRIPGQRGSERRSFVYRSGDPILR